MKKKYLVDVENVHESFVSQISPGKSDEIYLFCTEHVPRFNHTKLAEIKNGWLRFIEIKGGKQSLDMHISTFLGHIIDDRREFVIVSNDTDYDGVIDFWNRNGYNVKRVEVQKTEDATSGTAKLELNNRIMKLFAGQDCASKIASITMKNYALGHDAVYKEIVKHYGQERGQNMFNKIKNVI